MNIHTAPLIELVAPIENDTETFQKTITNPRLFKIVLMHYKHGLLRLIRILVMIKKSRYWSMHQKWKIY